MPINALRVVGRGIERRIASLTIDDTKRGVVDIAHPLHPNDHCFVNVQPISGSGRGVLLSDPTRSNSEAAQALPKHSIGPWPQAEAEWDILSRNEMQEDPLHVVVYARTKSDRDLLYVQA